MKKIKQLFAFVLCLLIIMSLTACSNGIDGKYYLEDSADYIELRSNFTYTQHRGKTLIISGTYKINGDAITFQINEDSLNTLIRAGYLSEDSDGKSQAKIKDDAIIFTVSYEDYTFETKYILRDNDGLLRTYESCFIANSVRENKINGNVRLLCDVDSYYSYRNWGTTAYITDKATNEKITAEHYLTRRLYCNGSLVWYHEYKPVELKVNHEYYIEIWAYTNSGPGDGYQCIKSYNLTISQKDAHYIPDESYV